MRVQTVMADLMLTYTQTGRCACPRCGYVVPGREVVETKSSGSGWWVKNCFASYVFHTTTEPTLVNMLGQVAGGRRMLPRH
jgi:hypothetical protein